MADAFPLRIEREQRVARLVLSRPASGNAIDLAMAEALSDAAARLDLDDDVRCVVLGGEGRLFCGGGDVRAFAAAGPDAAGVIKAVTGHLHSALARFARMEKPLVTLAHGPAAGAGLSLLCAGDIVLAARSAHFTSGYSAVGLTPDGGLSWRLPRLIGLRRAQEMILTNRRIGAEEAAAIGLVTEAVDDAVLAERGTWIAQRLARSATGALGRSRQLLLCSYSTPLETQMELESREISVAAATAHGQEGLRAFCEKREPDFA